MLGNGHNRSTKVRKTENLKNICILGKWKLMLTGEEWETFSKDLYLVGCKNKKIVNKRKAIRIQVERRLGTVQLSN